MINRISSSCHDDVWAAGAGLTTAWGAVQGPHPADPQQTEGLALTCDRDISHAWMKTSVWSQQSIARPAASDCTLSAVL